MKTKLFIFLSATAIAFNLVNAAHATGAGFYLGTQLGLSNTHNTTRSIPTGGTPTTESTDARNKGIGMRLFAGYGINEYLAIEGGFTRYAPSRYYPSSTPNNTTPAIRENGFDLTGKGMLPLQDFSVFAKAGLAVVRTSLSGNLNSSGTGSNGTTVYMHPVVGVGASYDITPNWVLDLSATRVLKMGGSSFQNADLIAAGISYHFVDKYCGQFLC